MLTVFRNSTLVNNETKNIDISVYSSFFCFYCGSHHERLDSNYETWSYKKKELQKDRTYRKSV